MPPYIPEDRFPMQVSPGVQVLGNHCFNLMLIAGKEKSLLLEAGVQVWWIKSSGSWTDLKFPRILSLSAIPTRTM